MVFHRLDKATFTDYGLNAAFDTIKVDFEPIYN
jgi:hypothetical protein